MTPTPEDARVSGAGTPAPLPTAMLPTLNETLRLLTTAPVPEGMEERVGERLQAALRAAPRQARILAWPTAAWPSPMRAAAAAAIAVVVAGGGWSVYTRVERQVNAGAPAAPQIVLPAGGFSSAGAKRTPDTLKGPLAQPEIAQPENVKPAEKKPKSNAARHASGPVQPVPVQSAH